MLRGEELAEAILHKEIWKRYDELSDNECLKNFWMTQPTSTYSHILIGVVDKYSKPGIINS